jgi:hypothetical protein
VDAVLAELSYAAVVTIVFAPGLGLLVMFWLKARRARRRTAAG